MQIIDYEVSRLKMPFKIAFSHAKKTRKETDNIIVKLHSQKNSGIGEGLPRDYVTGETPESALKILNEEIIPHFKKIKIKDFCQGIDEVMKYSSKLEKNKLAAFCSFETAYINLLCKEYDKGIKDILKYLGVESYEHEEIRYSAIIGLGMMSIFKAFLARRFDSAKIKVSPKNMNKIHLLKKILGNDVRLDANFSFDKNNMQTLIGIAKNSGIGKIEQPVRDDEIRFIKGLCDKNQIKIILDESVCSKKELNSYKDEDYIFNLRIAKNGGIINTILFYKELKKSGREVILGSLVGETVLSRYHIILAKHLDFIYLEGNYGRFLFKKDPINNPAFDSKGRLRHDLDLKDDIIWKT